MSPAPDTDEHPSHSQSVKAQLRLREMILAGDLPSGSRIAELALVEKLGVSRTPVREALQRLETQGMLARDGRSLMVASLDHNQLAELYTVRTELEGLAARLAARHAKRGMHAAIGEDGRCHGL